VTGTITYDSSANAVTAVGGTSSVPLGFIDLYNADLAGGWGKIHLQGQSQFLIECKLVIGDGTTPTYFASTFQQLSFGSSILTAHGQSLIFVASNAMVTFGRSLDEAVHQTDQGVCFSLAQSAYYGDAIVNNGGAVNVYGCFFINSGSQNMRLNGNSGTFRVWNSIISSGVGLAGTVIPFGCTILGVSIAYQAPPANVTVSNINISKAYYAFAPYFDGTYTLINWDVVVPLGALVWFSAARTYTINMVNCLSTAWTFNYGTATATVNRQYELDLDTTPGATVVLTDNAGLEVFRCVADETTGAIPTQIVTRGYYNQTHGDALQDKGPHILTMSKSGMQTHTESLMLTQKTQLQISLLSAALDGTATAGDIADGKTAYVSSTEQKITGTLIGPAVMVDVASGRAVLNLNRKKLSSPPVLSL
jgi:hypothetical protein